MTHWARDAVFYHVYPLGLCGAPERNVPHAKAENRLLQLRDWIPHWRHLGINALYLGPVFESMTHGYDTTDYYQVDRRLGTNEDLRELVSALHANGIRVVLDAVYNHVGRSFPAFQDVRKHGPASRYCAWFSGLRFDHRSPLGDPFTYDTWHGHYELVKLDLHNPEVRAHLIEATEHWLREYDIDGLRLDAADCLKLPFLRELVSHTKALKPDFWLMGEIVNGDYRKWTGPDLLDATTNYECYKGLYSSHNDRNYFEIAHSLTRQFGPEGVYQDLPLYAFADNHDVERLASILRHTPHLYPLYFMLFTMPGVPSIYYGSEWAVKGRKTRHSDSPLRPTLKPQDAENGNRELQEAIARLARVRHEVPALRHGAYQQLHVSSEQLVFARQSTEGCALVLVNGADQAVPLTFELPAGMPSRWVDVLNPGAVFEAKGQQLSIPDLPQTWGRVLISA